ncbi:hypothetical protein BDZ91DRAFT_760900 [Kalaharituber pfeilii]|nr:hypothetical protein BDZ91DRAFT_760900 [Kalaharituber pfeilii]
MSARMSARLFSYPEPHRRSLGKPILSVMEIGKVLKNRTMKIGKDKSTQNPGPSPGPTKLPSAPKKPTTKKPATPDASTPAQGIVVHGMALRKDLGKVRKWLESGNKIGKTVGIRWLRSKTRLVEEGKKTSSVVLYLEKMIEVAWGTLVESGPVRVG